MRGSEFSRLLQSHGWNLIRDQGNHKIFENSSGKRRTAGLHPNKDIQSPLLQRLIKRFDLNEEDVMPGKPPRGRVLPRRRELPPTGTLARLLVDSRLALELTQREVAEGINAGLRGDTRIRQSTVALWENRYQEIREPYIGRLRALFKWTDEQMKVVKSITQDISEESTGPELAETQTVVVERTGPQVETTVGPPIVPPPPPEPTPAVERKKPWEQGRIPVTGNGEPKVTPAPPTPRKPRREVSRASVEALRGAWRTDPKAWPVMGFADWKEMTGVELLRAQQVAVSSFVGAITNQNIALHGETQRLREELERLAEAQAGVQISEEELEDLRWKAGQYDELAARFFGKRPGS